MDVKIRESIKQLKISNQVGCIHLKWRGGEWRRWCLSIWTMLHGERNDIIKPETKKQIKISTTYQGHHGRAGGVRCTSAVAIWLVDGTNKSQEENHLKHAPLHVVVAVESNQNAKWNLYSWTTATNTAWSFVRWCTCFAAATAAEESNDVIKYTIVSKKTNKKKKLLREVYATQGHTQQVRGASHFRNQRIESVNKIAFAEGRHLVVVE